MFVNPRRLAVGAAVLAPVVSVSMPAAHAANTTPAKSFCTINATSADAHGAGAQSVVVCYATAQQALAGGVTGGGPVTSGIGPYGRVLLATYWSSRTGEGTPTYIMGDSCADKLYTMPPSWLPNTASWSRGACSSSKNFTADNMQGQSVIASNGFMAFDAPFVRNIHSITFGA